MGVQIALDDFGTGYCSLNYFKKFPLNILKIDKSFVSGLTTDPCERAIANAVATLGRDLNLSVVAEGVETNDVRLRGRRSEKDGGFNRRLNPRRWVLFVSTRFQPPCLVRSIARAT